MEVCCLAVFFIICLATTRKVAKYILLLIEEKTKVGNSTVELKFIIVTKLNVVSSYVLMHYVMPWLQSDISPCCHQLPL